MKKIKFQGKLNLNKEVVSKLNDDEMNGMYGGAKLTDRGCATSKICVRTTTDTYVTVSIVCIPITE